MQRSIKHESGQAAFSPPEESEGSCSCSLSRNHLGHQSLFLNRRSQKLRNLMIILMKLRLAHMQDTVRGRQFNNQSKMMVTTKVKVIRWNTQAILKGLRIQDSDDTVEYQDLGFIDGESWPLLIQEQKVCSNTRSCSVPRYIDNNSPVDVTSARPSNSYQSSCWMTT